MSPPRFGFATTLRLASSPQDAATASEFRRPLRAAVAFFVASIRRVLAARSPSFCSVSSPATLRAAHAGDDAREIGFYRLQHAHHMNGKCDDGMVVQEAVFDSKCPPATTSVVGGKIPCTAMHLVPVKIRAHALAPVSDALRFTVSTVALATP